MDQNEWDRAWDYHLDNYLQRGARTGAFCYKRLPKFNNAVEIACGSGRDSLYLYNKGIDCIATDYAENLISSLTKRFPAEMKVQQEDAFRTSFADKSIDVVFSNGFFVLFNDDEDIEKLVSERWRICRKQMVFIEHNSLNKVNVKRFEQKKMSDPVFNIRFWSPDELLKCVATSLERRGLKYSNIRVEKFGGIVDTLYVAHFLSKRFPIFQFLEGISETVAPSLYSLQPWALVERAAVIVDL